MSEAAFDVAAFAAQVHATPKEHHALRQDLLRGLKDYFQAAYGYDRYGAETVFQLPDRMREPHIYGFGLHRILHDRRISDDVKAGAAQYAIAIIAYGQDGGVPFALFDAIRFLAQYGHLEPDDLRYTLVATAGEYGPFRGMDRRGIMTTGEWILACSAMPVQERAFWLHSLIARHGDGSGASELADLLLGDAGMPVDLRTEICEAWVNFRQPRFTVPIPDGGGAYRSRFVAEHMQFWVSHSPSWPSHTMVRQGVVWLARLDGDPAAIARYYIGYRDTYADHVHGAVADVLTEHHEAIPEGQLKAVIEKGIAMSGSIPTRRRFYRLGTDLFGPRYLERATSDAANSVRQWAVRQLQRQA